MTHGPAIGLFSSHLEKDCPVPFGSIGHNEPTFNTFQRQRKWQHEKACLEFDS